MKKLIPLAILLSFWMLTQRPEAQTGGFRIIVHAANQQPPMQADRIAKIFLKKIKRWDDDTPITPVDQAVDSAVREAFTEAIHGKRVSTIVSYWTREIFSGRGVAPDKLPSDQSVIEFVRSRPGAIGYVSSSTALGEGEGVRELKVLEKK